MRPSISRPASSERTAAVALAVAILGLLAVAGLASRALPRGRQTSLSSSGVDLSRGIEMAVGVLFVVAIVVLVWAMWPSGDERPQLPRRRPAWQAYLLLAAVIVGLTLLQPTGLLDPRPPAGEAGDAAEESSNPGAASAASRWGPLLLTVALGFALLALAAQRQRTAAVPDEHHIVDDAGRATRGPAKLRPPPAAALGDDPRSRVLRAYARMESELDAAGWPRRPTEAPGQYRTRVSRAAPSTAPAVGPLTAAYEVARFADRPVDEARAASGEAALDQLLAAVRQVAR